MKAQLMMMAVYVAVTTELLAGLLGCEKKKEHVLTYYTKNGEGCEFG